MFNKISLFTISFFASFTIYANTVPAKIGTVLDDVIIKRTFIIFNNAADALKQKNECDVQATEIPTFVINDNKLIPSCWEPARGDGIGFLRYKNDFNDKEFSFNESKVKYKSIKLNTNSLKYK